MDVTQNVKNLIALHEQSGAEPRNHNSSIQQSIAHLKVHQLYSTQISSDLQDEKRKILEQLDR